MAQQPTEIETLENIKLLADIRRRKKKKKKKKPVRDSNEMAMLRHIRGIDPEDNPYF